jgi:hypothetical protein
VVPLPRERGRTSAYSAPFRLSHHALPPTPRKPTLQALPGWFYSKRFFGEKRKILPIFDHIVLKFIDFSQIFRPN